MPPGCPGNLKQSLPPARSPARRPDRWGLQTCVGWAAYKVASSNGTPARGGSHAPHRLDGRRRAGLRARAGRVRRRRSRPGGSVALGPAFRVGGAGQAVRSRRRRSDHVGRVPEGDERLRGPGPRPRRRDHQGGGRDTALRRGMVLPRRGARPAAVRRARARGGPRDAGTRRRAGPAARGGRSRCGRPRRSCGLRSAPGRSARGWSGDARVRLPGPPLPRSRRHGPRGRDARPWRDGPFRRRMPPLWRSARRGAAGSAEPVGRRAAVGSSASGRDAPGDAPRDAPRDTPVDGDPGGRCHGVRRDGSFGRCVSRLWRSARRGAAGTARPVGRRAAVGSSASGRDAPGHAAGAREPVGRPSARSGPARRGAGLGGPRPRGRLALRPLHAPVGDRGQGCRGRGGRGVRSRGARRGSAGSTSPGSRPQSRRTSPFPRTPATPAATLRAAGRDPRWSSRVARCRRRSRSS